MSFIAGSSSDVAWREFRRKWVPLLTTIMAIVLSLMPIVATWPLIPDLGFVVLLTWRLLRPEIWKPYHALGLGFFSDLLSGNPLGQAMLLWTGIFLALELIDSRLGFRDYLMDWLIAAVAIIFQSLGAWYIALLMGSEIQFGILAPQLALGIIAYPVIARIVLALDRWRLAR
jgi:rod shape-determining protein MreD